MKKSNTNDLAKEKLFAEFKESIKDLTVDELKEVTTFVLTLKAQHTPKPSSYHRKTNRK